MIQSRLWEPYAISGSIGDDGPTDGVPDADDGTSSGQSVRTVEPSGHAIDTRDWRAPVLSDAMYRIDHARWTLWLVVLDEHAEVA